MFRFRPQDMAMIEVAPTSPENLAEKLGELVSHSLSSTARVDLLDAETGEYRVLLQGILDLDEGIPER